MWDFLSNLGGAVKRPFTELPKGKMPDLGAVKPTLAGAASAGPQDLASLIPSAAQTRPDMPMPQVPSPMQPMARPAPLELPGPMALPAASKEWLPWNETQLGGKVRYNGPEHPDFVPNLGRPGPVRQPWSQEGAARNDWMMERAQRTPGAPGTVLGRDAQTGQEYAGGEWTGKIKRDWKDMAANALLGYGQAYNESGGNAWAGLGGAIGGGAGTAISPEMGRNYSFDRTQRPRILEDEARQAQASQLGMEQEMQRARIDEVRARGQESAEMAPLERDRVRAQTEGLRATAGMKDPEMAKAVQQSRINLNESRAEAARTGRVQLAKTYNSQTDTHEIVAVHPDGTVGPVPVGMSSDAQINKENIQSREKISTDRNTTNMRRTEKAQAGATGRTIISQRGQNERLQTRLGAEGSGQAKVASPELLQRYINERRSKGENVTLDHAKKKARESGYTVE